MMTIDRLVKYSRILLTLLVVLAIASLAMGMTPMPASRPHAPDLPDVNTGSDPSVTCIPLGLYGDIATLPLVAKLSDTSDNLTFVGTTNGLYVVAPGGKLQQFVYSPFGVKHIALIDDITGDGLREVVVALNDTQVPALRCYDGATWEKLWQFAPMARIWDKLWVERQLVITNLETAEDNDSQRLVITSGRCIISIDARDGSEQWRFGASSALWRMVTLGDSNDDSAAEVFAGSNDGHLYWLNARTGKVLWQTRLPEHDEADYRGMAHLVSDIVVLDGESGKVAVASADGWAQMYDLAKKKREWDTRVFEEVSPAYQMSDYLLITPTADISGDDLPEILLTKTRSDYQAQYSGATTNGGAALCDSAGNKLWDRDACVWPGTAFETGVFEGKQVFLERTGQEFTIVDLKDSETVLHTIPLDALNTLSVVMKHPAENGYLAFSSNSDLVTISSDGTVRWHYPRIMSVKAEGGSFVGDPIEDVLFWGEYGAEQSPSTVPVYDIEGGPIGITDPRYSPEGQDPDTRLLQMMDGATRGIAWSYEVPYGEFKSLGGLKGMQVTPDLVGSDGVRDIVGYRQDTVFIFSGKDGACSNLAAGQPIASLEVIRNGSSGNAIAVGVAGGLMIMDATGTLLWATTSAEWIGNESSRFMALDDVNSDNVSDLALISTANITVLRSVAATDNYELHLMFPAETDYSISDVEMVPDSDNDGVRDLACIQRAQEKQQGEQYVQPPNPLLSKTSLVDGKELFRVQLPVSWWTDCDLACGDFNSDGCADSFFVAYMDSGLRLLIFSGKDGVTVRTHPVNTNPMESRDGSELQFRNIGDVDNDGADDLVYHTDTYDGIKIDYSKGYSYTYTGHEEMQWSIVVYSVAQDSILSSIPATPLFKMGYTGETYATMLPADVDADDQLEVIAKVFEPSMPSYDPDAYMHYGSSPRQYIAVVDVDSGRRLAGFTGLDTRNMSPFETHQPGILGVAACGGALFLNLGPDLHVTSPKDGARMGPTVGVRWEGPTDGDFSQVFVDGVRNDLTNGLESELFLARGNHIIFVRSVDDCGRICYGPSDLSTPVAIKVTPSPWKPVWLVLSLFVLIATVLLLFYARVNRIWRARKRAAK